MILPRNKRACPPVFENSPFREVDPVTYAVHTAALFATLYAAVVLMRFA